MKKTISVDSIFESKRTELEAAGLSPQACDQALLLVAVEFLDTLMTVNARLRAKLLDE